jgi:hypothetical protein
VIPRWTPRSRLTRGGLNGLRSKIAANTIRIDPRTELELVQIPSGQLLRRSRPIATWATLAGSGPSYTFTEAEPTSSGGGWVAGSTTGTAYEVNGVTGLSGTRQLVRPDRLGNWRFQSLRFGSSVTYCNSTFTVSLSTTCGSGASSAVVSLSYGGTTVTLTAPNDSSSYRFTSTTLSGWTDGTTGTLTVTCSGYVTAVRSVPLECVSSSEPIYLTFATIALAAHATGACGPDEQYAYIAVDMTVIINGSSVGSITTTEEIDPGGIPIPYVYFAVTTDYGFPPTIQVTWSDGIGSKTCTVTGCQYLGAYHCSADYGGGPPSPC